MTNLPLIAYVGKLREPRQPQPHCRDLTDWHGNVIGSCYIATRWRVRSWIGSEMCQIRATVDGRHYTGRGFGEGMAVKLRPRAGKGT